ncbi:MAG: HAD family phosphatase [Ferruginibacter sp.]
MANTKNIIFDLGGVLLNIDYQKTFDAFRQLGFTHFEHMYSQYTADALFKKLETGKISKEDFYKTLINQLPGISEQDITEAWNAMLLDFRLPSLNFLQTLSANHQLFLLSNTNAIHFPAFRQIFFQETGMVSIDDFFTKAYYSHLIKLRKPEKAVFEFVLQDAGILAAETLFIDDSYNNIEAAMSLGFSTHLLVAGETIETLDYSK